MAARGPMKLRTRLVISFVYVLLAVVLALTIPLGVSLAERGRADLEAQTVQDAQTIAAYLDPVLMRDPARLGAVLAETTPPNVTRVVVVGADGTVLHDSTGNAVGQDFANGERPEIDAALRGEPNAQDRFSDTIDARLLVAAAPIIQGVPVGALRLTRDYAEVEAATRRTTIGLAVIGGTTVLAGVIIAFALAGSIAKPIQRLAGAAHRLGDGDLTTRAGDVGGAAEVQDLGRSFDAMATRLEATVRAQREFVANASHQLRTPLTGMKLRLEAAMAATDDPGLRQQLVAADAEVDRLAEIVERLLATARRIELGEADDVDLADAARRAAARWRDRASQHGATVTADGDGGIAAADPTDVDQILDILVDNAIAYAPGSVAIATGSDDGAAWLAVRDGGPGIPPDERARVTERFYRGRGAPSGGSGLGLAIAHELAVRWSGTLAILDGEREGTEVLVRFPRGHAEPATTDDEELSP